MNRKKSPIALMLLLLAMALPALAQEGGSVDPEAPAELREAIRRHFQNGLRQALALSDDQMAAILPRVESLEEGKRAAVRARREVVRELQAGMHEGASDEDLQALLDRLESIEQRQQEEERRLFREIDGQLSTRQRVQLRFFVQRFRGELEQRMRDLRDGRGERGRRRAPGGRR